MPVFLTFLKCLLDKVACFATLAKLGSSKFGMLLNCWTDVSGQYRYTVSTASILCILFWTRPKNSNSNTKVLVSNLSELLKHTYQSLFYCIAALLLNAFQFQFRFSHYYWSDSNDNVAAVCKTLLWYPIYRCAIYLYFIASYPTCYRISLVSLN